MSDRVLGKCSLCGGLVVSPEIWHGVYPPVPHCRDCGATKKLPQINMERAKQHTGIRDGFTND